MKTKKKSLTFLIFLSIFILISGCLNNNSPDTQLPDDSSNPEDDDKEDTTPDDDEPNPDDDVETPIDDDDDGKDNDTGEDDPPDETSETKLKPVPKIQISGDKISGFEDIDFVFNRENSISFSTSESFDPDGEIIEYTLDIGMDNLVTKNENIEISHLYELPGKYSITLTVVDNDHQENSTYFDILVVEEWGMWAEQIITDEVYGKMEIEIDLFGNVKSNERSIDLLKERIRQYCSKPDGITITITEEENNDLQRITTEDLWRTMLEYRDKYSDQNTLVIYIMYFNGDYSLGSALGLTFESTSFAVFKGSSFDLAANEKFSKEDIEKTILIHEFFHLNGLVNKGYQSAYPHETKKILHKHHCMNQDCVMYYQLETYDVVNYIQETLPNDICYFCQEDMKRFE